jgi:hypothetical protein
MRVVLFRLLFQPNPGGIMSLITWKDDETKQIPLTDGVFIKNGMKT